MTPGARASLVVIVAMALVGCATRPPERIPYNAEARRDVVRILVLEPAPPATLVVSPGAFQQTAAASSGYGGILLLPLLLATAADELAKSKTFTQAAIDAGFDPGDTLATSLAAELESRGFRVTRQRVARAAAAPPFEPRWLGDFRPWSDSSDAVLDVQWLVVGFRARDPTLPYLPLANASVRLVEPRSHVILYRDTVSFGLGFDASLIGRYGGDLPIGLVADDRHRFADFAELVARKDEAFDALRDAARVLAGRIAFDLAPP